MNEFENEVLMRGPVKMFKEGGEVASNSQLIADYLQQQTQGDISSSDPIGTAQQLLSSVTKANSKAAPIRQSVKRVSRGAGSDASRSKEMNLKVAPLSKSKQMVLDTSSTPEEDKPKGSAREQMDDLVRSYELQLKAVKNKARGLSADTFGAPTLEGATLAKNTLAKRRFAEGGEVKKPGEDGPSATNLLRRLGLSLARGIPQAATGLVDLAALPLTASGKMKAEDIVGTTDYLTKRGLLPKPQTGLANESAELLSSMASPGGAAKAAVVGVLGPKGIIDAARRSQLFKGKGLTVPDENFSAQEMLKMLREQGVDT
jgi:hypothetical protein